MTKNNFNKLHYLNKFIKITKLFKMFLRWLDMMNLNIYRRNLMNYLAIKNYSQ